MQRRTATSIGRTLHSQHSLVVAARRSLSSSGSSGNGAVLVQVGASASFPFPLPSRPLLPPLGRYEKNALCVYMCGMGGWWIDLIGWLAEYKLYFLGIGGSIHVRYDRIDWLTVRTLQHTYYYSPTPGGAPRRLSSSSSIVDSYSRLKKKNEKKKRIIMHNPGCVEIRYGAIHPQIK